MKYLIIGLIVVLVGGGILAILDAMWNLAEDFEKGWRDVD